MGVRNASRPALLTHTPYFEDRVLPACPLRLIIEALPPGSPSLAAYLQRTYGSAPAAKLTSWDWNAVDVVWFDRLPRTVQMRCDEPLGSEPRLPSVPPRGGHHRRPDGDDPLAAFYALPAAFGFSRAFVATGLLWRFRAEDSCYGAKAHQGGRRGRLDLSDDGGWLEVVHVQERLFPSRDEGVYMNRARGSGLWYRAGRMQTRDDTFQNPHCDIYEPKGVPLDRCNERTLKWNSTDVLNVSHFSDLRKEGIETVYLARRAGDTLAFMDQHRPFTPVCGALGSRSYLPFYTHEVVGLRLPMYHGRVKRKYNCTAGWAPQFVAGSFSSPQPSPQGTACNLFGIGTRFGGLCMEGLESLRWGWPDDPADAGRCPRGCVMMSNVVWHCPHNASGLGNMTSLPQLLLSSKLGSHARVPKMRPTFL